jgi:hypothetical protein
MFVNRFRVNATTSNIPWNEKMGQVNPSSSLWTEIAKSWKNTIKALFSKYKECPQSWCNKNTKYHKAKSSLTKKHLKPNEQIYHISREGERHSINKLACQYFETHRSIQLFSPRLSSASLYLMNKINPHKKGTIKSRW